MFRRQPQFVADPGTFADLQLCSRTLIDCSGTAVVQAARAASEKAIYLDPFMPFSVGSARCLPGGPKQLLVFYGRGCYLYNASNHQGCFWNASVQAFQGAGCVNDMALQCVCKGVADVKGASAVRLPQMTLARMVIVPPLGLMGKIAMLAAFVFSLFGFFLA